MERKERMERKGKNGKKRKRHAWRVSSKSAIDEPIKLHHGFGKICN